MVVQKFAELNLFFNIFNNLNLKKQISNKGRGRNTKYLLEGVMGRVIGSGGRII
jgi:hypothetical protein